MSGEKLNAGCRLDGRLVGVDKGERRERTMERDGVRVLYLTYDGLLEPLGQSQVLQYVLQLGRSHEITVVSYEKPEDLRDLQSRMTVDAALAEAGVAWVPLRYHKHPTSVATSYDLAVGLLVGVYLAVRRRIQVVHARSYVPAVLGLTLKRLLGLRFIFDMRGFWADQRVDCGAWPRDCSLYRAAKWFERRFLTSADAVISLTRAGVAAILDCSPHKHGRYTPGTHIPVKPAEAWAAERATHMVILAWNFQDQIVRRMGPFAGAGGRFAQVLP